MKGRVCLSTPDKRKILAPVTCVRAFVALVFAVASSTASAEDPLEAVVKQQVGENQASAKAQDRIDEISEETDSLAAKYRASLQNTEQLRVYNDQLEGLLEAQVVEMASLRRQIDEVTVIGRQVTPHMTKMLETLEDFVALDLPFLGDERAQRITSLKEMMGRADVTISEKYRRILEAYQIENEYGRTIEAYRGELESGSDSRTVDFLRIGRNALLYQTLDGQESGFWNKQAKAWQQLEGYRIPIREGLRMARKQRAPDLVKVPMPKPEVSVQ